MTNLSIKSAVDAVRTRIFEATIEARQLIGARRLFLQMKIRTADRTIKALDAERYKHFCDRITLQAELDDLERESAALDQETIVRRAA